MGKFLDFLVRYTEDVYKEWEKGGIGRQVLELRNEYLANLEKAEQAEKMEVTQKQSKSIKKLNNLEQTN